MQLNSYVFVLAFLPLMVLAFFTLGKINKWMGKVVLIIGSIIFYGYSDSSALVILGISLAINLCFVKLIEGSEWKKLFMAIPVIINVGLLCYFKYTNFAIININALLGSGFALKELALPVGISFFTFQQIAYIVAVYRREIASVSVMDYIAYILYFPKLLMGPLMEPVDFLEQLNDEKINKIDWNHIAYGAKIFSLGLLKKDYLRTPSRKWFRGHLRTWGQRLWIGFWQCSPIRSRSISTSVATAIWLLEHP